MKKIDKVEGTTNDKDRYLQLIHDNLYTDKAKFDVNMFNHPLLVAIGALIIGGKRGTVREVLNFNFDNVLEYYLGLYGTKCDVVFQLPSLRKDQDVLSIIHMDFYRRMLLMLLVIS